MRKTLLLASAFALLLSACCPQPAPAPTPTPTPTPTATPSPSPTPAFEPRILQAQWLEVDDSHHFWVALEETQEPAPITKDPLLPEGNADCTGLRVNFYENEMAFDPVYSFLEGYNCQPYQLEFFSSDWNFDGYTDLAFRNMSYGFRYQSYAFYLWDPETETFRQNPDGLNELNNPALHPQEGSITSFSSAAGGSDWYDYYRYEDGKLTPARRCAFAYDWDAGYFAVTVEDFVDGEWETVFQEENHDGDQNEYRLWRNDINYHGGGG